MKDKPFRIEDVYRQDVADLLGSHQKSKVIHSSGDIDASGDEVESPFRSLLRRRLPNQYLVGHGHIVDRSLNVSPQFDVIIADNNATPILFEAENGCQYFPWESLFAVGEIKATYHRGKYPIRRFAKNTAALKNNLVRETTPPNYLGNNIFLEGFESSDKRSSRNPLFSFMVFFDSGTAKHADLADEYCGPTDEHLPAVVAFLDGKTIVKATLKKTPDGIHMGEIDLNPLNVIERKDIHWIHMNCEPQRAAGAKALTILIFGLFDHLRRCVLMPPPIHDYLKAIMETGGSEPSLLSVSAFAEMCKLAGAPLPKSIHTLLKRRAAGGKSPFRNFTDKELPQLTKDLSISGDELERFLIAIRKATQAGKG
jgi:hypothetical protein